jgi:hypothetical protein
LAPEQALDLGLAGGEELQDLEVLYKKYRDFDYYDALPTKEGKGIEYCTRYIIQ